MSSLELTKYSIHNKAVAQSLQLLRDSIERGGGLESTLTGVGRCNTCCCCRYANHRGESGSIDKIAEQIADIYDERFRLPLIHWERHFSPFSQL
jgi:type II secretory pathway component PulF